MNLAKRVTTLFLLGSIGLSLLTGCSNKSEQEDINENYPSNTEAISYSEDSADTLSSFDKRFGDFARERFFSETITPNQVNPYNPSLNWAGIIHLVKAEVPYEFVNTCIENIVPNSDIRGGVLGLTTKAHINGLVDCFIGLYESSEGDVGKILEYNDSFDPRDREYFLRDRITPEQANPYGELNQKYGTRITYRDIRFFLDEGIPFETIEQKAKENVINWRIKKWPKKINRIIIPDGLYTF